MQGYFKLQQYMNYIMYKKYRPVHCVQKVQNSALCIKSTDQCIVYREYRYYIEYMRVQVLDGLQRVKVY